MTSLNSIINDSATGLQTAQTALHVVANNVSNVNTPGFIQTQVNQSSLVAGAAGAGVTVADIAQITNKYLQAASFDANAQSSAASVVSSSMDQAQSLFGDPTTSNSLFSTLDSVFSAFSNLAATPSGAATASAVAAAGAFFNQAATINTSLQTLSSQASQQITSNVGTANQLLVQISQLNSVISRNSASGADVTGAQNQQNQLITQLTSLMNISVASTPTGGVTVQAANGASLVGTAGASSLSYVPSSTGSGQVMLTNATGVASSLNGVITSGSIGGLSQLCNSDLPALSSQLSALTIGAANTLNAVSNAHSAAPAPTTLTGQSTGLDLPTVIGDFSGQTTIALVNPTTNALDHSIAIDFTADTITVDGGSPTSFAPSNFLSTLNSAMAPTGATATYANGVLSLASNSSDGVAVQDSATTPASDGGQGFSQFFGLNNLVTSGSLTNYNTGLQASDASGFPAGQTISLQIADASGNAVKTVTVTTPGGTVGDLINALNAAPGGVGTYGSFALSSTGALSFTPASSGDSVAVVSDDTANTATGASISQLFGVGAATKNTAAANLSVNPAFVQNPNLVPTATLNLGAAAGQAVLASGDTSGADALGQAGLDTLYFPAVSGVAAATTTLSDYAASISGVIANAASAADNAQTSATTVASNATAALSSAQGVSIDQEMINLTTYQQAYNASARLVQAASDLFSTLLTMVGT